MYEQINLASKSESQTLKYESKSESQVLSPSRTWVRVGLESESHPSHTSLERGIFNKKVLFQKYFNSQFYTRLLVIPRLNLARKCFKHKFNPTDLLLYILAFLKLGNVEALNLYHGVNCSVGMSVVEATSRCLLLLSRSIPTLTNFWSSIWTKCTCTSMKYVL